MTHNDVSFSMVKCFSCAANILFLYQGDPLLLDKRRAQKFMETPRFSGNLGHLDIMLFKLGYKPENRNTAKGFDIRSVRSHTKLEQRFA